MSDSPLSFVLPSPCRPMVEDIAVLPTFALKSPRIMERQNDLSPHSRPVSDDESEDEDNVDGNFILEKTKDKNTFVLVIDDVKDDSVSLMLHDIIPPEGFDICNTQTLPGVSADKITANLQVMVTGCCLGLYETLGEPGPVIKTAVRTSVAKSLESQQSSACLSTTNQTEEMIFPLDGVGDQTSNVGTESSQPNHQSRQGSVSGHSSKAIKRQSRIFVRPKGQCLINVSGDVVVVCYDEDDRDPQATDAAVIVSAA
ncbi:hypothetical protein ElyMa_003422300 [Elysia marginata]|uniref:Uncharacterized protein n=1 Tax=Elysia marginata TaxID=1093978 RepID=A0AAV4JQY1_9GAST|nr:hypothetical protein ElyMa_003422300 [Elysia marginata]